MATIGANTGNGFNLQGTTTNNNAATGDVGEYITGSGTIGVSTGTSGQFQDITSISLTAGDWDVRALSRVRTATAASDFQLAISQYSGNTTTDHVSSNNVAFQTTTNTQDWAIGIPVTRLSLSATTTIYLKANFATVDGGTQVLSAYINARRVR